MDPVQLNKGGDSRKLVIAEEPIVLNNQTNVSRGGFNIKENRTPAEVHFYRCNQCVYETLVKSTLESHKKRLHPRYKLNRNNATRNTLRLDGNNATTDTNSKSINNSHSELLDFQRCDKCVYAAVTVRELELHKKLLHPKKELIRNNATRDLFNNVALRQDRNNVTVDIDINSESTDNLLSPSNLSPDRHFYKCDQCVYATLIVRELELHKKRLHPKEELIRNNATRDLFNNVALRQDRNNVTVDIDINSKSTDNLLSPSNLLPDQHFYKCDQCVYETSLMSALVTHKELFHSALKQHGNGSKIRETLSVYTKNNEQTCSDRNFKRFSELEALQLNQAELINKFMKRNKDLRVINSEITKIDSCTTKEQSVRNSNLTIDQLIAKATTETSLVRLVKLEHMDLSHIGLHINGWSNFANSRYAAYLKTILNIIKREHCYAKEEEAPVCENLELRDVKLSETDLTIDSEVTSLSIENIEAVIIACRQIAKETGHVNGSCGNNCTMEQLLDRLKIPISMVLNHEEPYVPNPGPKDKNPEKKCFIDFDTILAKTELIKDEMTEAELKTDNIETENTEPVANDEEISLWDTLDDIIKGEEIDKPSDSGKIITEVIEILDEMESYRILQSETTNNKELKNSSTFSLQDLPIVDLTSEEDFNLSYGASNPSCGTTNPNCDTSNPNCGTSSPNCGASNPSCGTSNLSHASLNLLNSLTNPAVVDLTYEDDLISTCATLLDNTSKENDNTSSIIDLTCEENVSSGCSMPGPSCINSAQRTENNTPVISAEPITREDKNKNSDKPNVTCSEGVKVPVVQTKLLNPPICQSIQPKENTNKELVAYSSNTKDLMQPKGKIGKRRMSSSQNLGSSKISKCGEASVDDGCPTAMENNVEKSPMDLTIKPSSDTNTNTKTEYLDEIWVFLENGNLLGFAYDFPITSDLYTITENYGNFAVATVKNRVIKNQPKEKHGLRDSIVNKIEKSGTINRSSKLEQTRTIKMFDKKAMERKRRLSNSLVYEDTLHSSKQLKKQRLSSSINELTCAQPKNLESQNALSKDEKPKPLTSFVQDRESTTKPANKGDLQSFVKLTECRKRKFSYWADHENTETTPEDTNIPNTNTKPKLVSEGQSKAHKELTRLKHDDSLDHSKAKKSNCGKRPSTGDKQSKNQKELDYIEVKKSDNKTSKVRARDKSEGREETSEGVRTRSRTPTALIISPEMQYNKSTCVKKPIIGEAQSKSQKALDDTKAKKKPGDDTQPNTQESKQKPDVSCYKNMDNIEAKKSNHTPKGRARDKSEGREETTEGVRTRSRTPTALVISLEMQYNKSTCVKKPIIEEAQSKSQKALDDTKAKKKPGDDAQLETQESKQKPDVPCYKIMDNIAAAKKSDNTSKVRARDKSEGREETSEGVRTRSRTPTALVISPEMQYNKSTCIKKPIIGEAQSKSQKALDDTRAKKKPGDDAQLETQESKQKPDVPCYKNMDNIAAIKKSDNKTPKVRARAKSVEHEREKTSEDIRTRSRTPTALVINPELQYNTRAKSTETLCNKTENQESNCRRTRSKSRTREQKEDPTKNQDTKNVSSKGSSVKTKDQEAKSSHKSPGGSKKIESEQTQDARSRSGRSKNKNPNHMSIRTAQKQKATIKNKNEAETDQEASQFNKELEKLDAFFSIDTVIDRLIRKNKALLLADEQARLKATKEKVGKASTSTKRATTKTSPSTEKASGSKRKATSSKQKAASSTDQGKTSTDDGKASQGAKVEEQLIKNNEKYKAWKKGKSVMKSRPTKGSQKLSSIENMKDTNNAQKGKKINNEDIQLKDQNLSRTHKKIAKAANFISEDISNIMSLLTLEPKAASSKDQSRQLNVKKIASSETPEVSSKDKGLQSKILKKTGSLEIEEASSKDQGGQFNVKKISSEIEGGSSKDQGLELKILTKTEEANSKDQHCQLNLEKVDSKTKEANSKYLSSQSNVLKIVGASEFKMNKSELEKYKTSLTKEPSSEDQGLQSKVSKNIAHPKTEEASSKDQSLQLKVLKKIELSETQEVSSKDQGLPSEVLKKTKSSETNQGPQSKISKKFQYSDTKKANPKDEGTQSKASTSISQSNLEKCNTLEPETTCSKDQEPPLQVLKQIESLETKEASIQSKILKKIKRSGTKKSSIKYDGSKSKASTSESQSKAEKCNTSETEDQDLQSRVLKHQSQQLKILKKIERSGTKKLSIKDEGSKSKASLLETQSKPEKCNTSETEEEGQGLQLKVVKEKSKHQSQQLKILKKIERSGTKKLSIKDEGSKSKASILETQSKPEKCNTSETEEEGQGLQLKVVKKKSKDQSQQLKILKKIECSGTKKLSIKDEGSKSKASILETQSKPEKCNTSKTEEEGQGLQLKVVKEKSKDQSQQLKILKKINYSETKKSIRKDKCNKSKASTSESQFKPEKFNTSETEEENQSLQLKVWKETILKKMEHSGTNKSSSKNKGSKSKASTSESQSKQKKINISETEKEDESLQFKVVEEKSKDQSQQLKILKEIKSSKTEKATGKEGSLSKISTSEIKEGGGGKDQSSHSTALKTVDASTSKTSKPELRKCNASEVKKLSKKNQGRPSKASTSIYQSESSKSDTTKNMEVTKDAEDKKTDKNLQENSDKNVQISENLAYLEEVIGTQAKAGNITVGKIDAGSTNKSKDENLSNKKPGPKELEKLSSRRRSTKQIKKKIRKKTSNKRTAKIYASVTEDLISVDTYTKQYSRLKQKESTCKGNTNQTSIGPLESVALAAEEKWIESKSSKSKIENPTIEVLSSKSDISKLTNVFSSNSETEKPTSEVLSSTSGTSKPTNVFSANSEGEEPTNKVLSSKSDTSKPTNAFSSNSETEEPTNKVVSSNSETEEPTNAFSSNSETEELTNKVLSTKSDTSKPTNAFSSNSETEEPTNKVVSSNSETEEPTNEVLSSKSDTLKPTNAFSSNSETEEPTNETLSSKSDTSKPTNAFSSNSEPEELTNKVLSSNSETEEPTNEALSSKFDTSKPTNAFSSNSETEELTNKVFSSNSETEEPTNEALSSKSDTSKPTNAFSSNSETEEPTNETLSSKSDTSKPTNAFYSNSDTEELTNKVLSSNSETEEPTNETLSSKSDTSKPTNAFSSNSETEELTNKVFCSNSETEEPTNEALSSKSDTSKPTNAFSSNSETEEPTNKVLSSNSETEEPTNEVLSSKSDTSKPTNAFSSNSDTEKPTNEVLSSKSDTSRPTNALSSNSETEKPTNAVLSSKSDASKPTNVFSSNCETENPTNEALSSKSHTSKPTNEVLSSKSDTLKPTNAFSSNSETKKPTNEVLSPKSDTSKPTNAFSSHSETEKPTNEVLFSKSDTSKPTNVFSSNSETENPTNEVLSSKSDTSKPTSEVVLTQLDIHKESLNIKNFCFPKFKETFNNSRGVDPKAVDEAAAIIGNVIWSTVGEMMEHFASSLQSSTSASTSSPDVLVSTLKKAFDNVSSRFKNTFENCNENEVGSNILPEVKEVCTRSSKERNENNEEGCSSPEDPKKSNDESSSLEDLKESNEKDCSSLPEDLKKSTDENCSSLEDLKEKNDNCSSPEDPKESIAEICASLEDLLESTRKNCLNLEDPKESIHENVSNLEDTSTKNLTTNEDPKEHSISASINQTTDVEEEIIEMFHENQICTSIDVEVQDVSTENEDASIEDEGASSDCPSSNIRLEAVEVSSPPSNVSFELERQNTSTNLNCLLTNQIFADVNVPTEEPENITQVPEMKCMSCRISKRFPHRSKKYKCACDLLNKKLTENSSGYSNVAQLLNGLVKSDECKLCMLKRRRCNILKPRSSECTCGSASKKLYVIQSSKRNLQQEHSYAESSGFRQYRKKRNLIANMRSVKLLNKKIKSDHSYAAVDNTSNCESPPPDVPVNIDVSPTPSDDINIPIDFNQEIDASAIEKTETKTKTIAPKAKSKNCVKFVFLKCPVPLIKRKPRVYLNKKGKQKQTGNTPKIRLKTKLPEYEIDKTGYTCDKCAYEAKLQDPNFQQKKDLFKGDTELLKSCEICGDLIRSSNTFVNTPVNNSTRHNVFKCDSPKKKSD